MKISKATLIRTLIAGLAFVNQILVIAGLSPLSFISNETITLLVSTLWTVVAGAIAWWKNNSFTEAAIKADAIKREIQAAITPAVENKDINSDLVEEK